VTQGLISIADGLIVYDENQGLCWLANANLAGHATAREILGVTGINPDGTMDYATALNWVAALNNFDRGKGALGQHNWQLPQNPLDDPTCSSFNNGNFGVSCTGTALGNLYNIGLGVPYPNSVLPGFTDSTPPFVNLQPGLLRAGGNCDTDRAAALGRGSHPLYNRACSGQSRLRHEHRFILDPQRRPFRLG
jgi:hypothetical protein